MCGLVGMAGAINQASEKAFRDLLIVDTIRGPHSTGVAFVAANGETTITKQVGNPFELFDSVKYQAEMRFKNCVLMGHNRYATIGKVTKGNAHPFECEHIVGAHNGTLNTKYLLADHTDYAVDSQNLYHNMSLHGVDDTTSKMGGAYALTWYDKKTKEINFLRNTERTLYYVFSQDFKTIYWASEDWMLYAILDKHKIKHGHAVMFEPFKHYSIEIIGSSFDELAGFTISDVEKYKAPVYKAPVTAYDINKKYASTADNHKIATKYAKYLKKDVHFYISGSVETSIGSSNTTYLVGKVMDDSLETVNVRVYLDKTLDKLEWAEMQACGGSYWGKVKSINCLEGGYGLIDKRSIKEVIDSTDDLDPDYDDVIEEKPFHGFNDRMLSEKDWQLATIKGCSWCGEQPLEDEDEELVWLSSSEHVCKHCSENESVQDIINQ